MKERHAVILLALLAAPLNIDAQWATYRDPTTPRTKDGRPNLSAPAPRANGKPDLSGIWQAESAPVAEIRQFLLSGDINGLGEDLPSKYFFNFFADVPFGMEPFQPEAAAAFRRLAQNRRKPPTLCPPPSLPLTDLLPVPYKIVQTPRATLFLYEADSVFRQIFTDGRKLPEDPQPGWLGYSVGKWMGDSFVVETVGFNDKGPLDVIGHPRSESMRMTESFRRRDFGHLEASITIDDPRTYLMPVTIRVGFRLVPDTELLESFCSEGEKDLPHLVDQ
ncbi:MAG TPA: hypothetical protein VKV74_13220 [Bryobacteraceae bacterium]|nr:hypothetical protein [Bryobacteraceae bacterium]